jgi:hypothetical protein
MTAMEYTVDDGIQILERTPATLRAMLEGLDPTWTDATEGPDTWSPYIILGHLIHGERGDWITRAAIILGTDESQAFAPYDRFAQLHESAGKSLVMLLDEFATVRARRGRAMATVSADHGPLTQSAFHRLHHAIL